MVTWTSEEQIWFLAVHLILHAVLVISAQDYQHHIWLFLLLITVHLHVWSLVCPRHTHFKFCDPLTGELLQTKGYGSWHPWQLSEKLSILHQLHLRYNMQTNLNKGSYEVTGFKFLSLKSRLKSPLISSFKPHLAVEWITIYMPFVVILENQDLFALDL